MKEFTYEDPDITLNQGKLGPVKLIKHKNQLMALKQIKKSELDHHKRIEHLKQEKQLLTSLNRQEPESTFIVQLIQTFLAKEHVCLAFEYLPGLNLFELMPTLPS